MFIVNFYKKKSFYISLLVIIIFSYNVFAPQIQSIVNPYSSVSIVGSVGAVTPIPVIDRQSCITSDGNVWVAWRNGTTNSLRISNSTDNTTWTHTLPSGVSGSEINPAIDCNGTTVVAIAKDVNDIWVGNITSGFSTLSESVITNGENNSYSKDQLSVKVMPNDVTYIMSKQSATNVTIFKSTNRITTWSNVSIATDDTSDGGTFTSTRDTMRMLVNGSGGSNDEILLIGNNDSGDMIQYKSSDGASTFGAKSVIDVNTICDIGDSLWANTYNGKAYVTCTDYSFTSSVQTNGAYCIHNSSDFGDTWSAESCYNTTIATHGCLDASNAIDTNTGDVLMICAAVNGTGSGTNNTLQMMRWNGTWTTEYNLSDVTVGQTGSNRFYMPHGSALGTNGYISLIVSDDDSLNLTFMYVNISSGVSEGSSNTPPTQGTPILNSSSNGNFTSDNLTVYNQSTADSDGDLVKNIYDWRVNGSSIAVLNMPFEGGSTSTFTKDYSTFSNNGIVSGATWNSTGGYDGNGAYEFDGSSNATIVAVKNTSITNNSVGTFVVRTKIQTIANTMKLINYGGADVTDPGVLGLEIRNNGSDNLFSIIQRDEDGSDANSAYGSTVVQTNTWYQIALTSNGTYWQIYVNGVPETMSDGLGSGNTGEWFSNTSLTNPTKLTIGASFFDGSFYGTTEKMTIDEVKIFNRTLSDEQIQALYNNRTDLIVSQETQLGDVWQASITPNDGVEDGSTITSNILNVQADADVTDPTITSISVNDTNPRTTNIVELLWNVTDETALNETWIVIQNASGTHTISIINTSSTSAQVGYNYTVNDPAGTILNFTAYVNDSSGNSVNSATLSIAMDTCVVPQDDVIITSSSVLCDGTYSVTDTGDDGIIIMNSSSIGVSCNATIIDGQTGSGTAFINSFGLGGSNNYVGNCTINNFNRGIQFTNPASFIIRNNTLQNITSVPIQFGGSSHDNIVDNNTIINVSTGQSTAISFQSHNTSITNNIIVQGGSLAIVGTNVFNATVTGNNVSGAGTFYALKMNDVNDSFISNNNLTASITCLQMINNTDVGSLRNTITGNLLSGCQNGLEIIYSSDNVFTSNTITSNTQYGIKMINTSNNNFTSNLITSGTQEGFYLENSNSSFINNNNFTSNGYNGLKLAKGSNGNIGVYVINNLIDSNIFSGVTSDSNDNKVVFANNTISNNVLDGIIPSGFDELTNNTIKLNGNYGINLSSSSTASSLIIQNNTLFENNATAIYASSVSNLTIRYNTIYNQSIISGGFFYSSLSILNVSGEVYNRDPFGGAFGGADNVTYWFCSGDNCDVPIYSDNTLNTIADGVNNFTIAAIEWDTTGIGGSIVNSTLVFNPNDWGSTCADFNTTVQGFGVTVINCPIFKNDYLISSGATSSYSVDETGLTFRTIDTSPSFTNYINVGSNGISLTLSNSSFIYNNTIYNNSDSGIVVTGDSNIITNNTIFNQSVSGAYGIELTSTATSNSIYNNYLNVSSGNAYDAGTSNTWNISKTTGTNIIGGSNLGGNFYEDYTGTDGNSDGIGDTTYSISGGSIDYLPLTNSITINLIGFLLTLPGESTINATNESANTSIMFFNSTSNTYYDMDPCVEGTIACQNETTPFFLYQNTGNVNLSITISLNDNLPATLQLTANTVYNASTSSEVNTTPLLIGNSLIPNSTLNTFFFGDFINAYPADSTSRNITSNGTQT